MAIFYFSKLLLPDIENKIQGPGWEGFKKSVIALMIHQRIAVFDAEAGASGHWKPLSPATLEIREDKLPGVKSNNPVTRKRQIERAKAKAAAKGMNAIKILQDKGLLRSSFTGVPFGSAGAQGAALHKEEIGEDEVAISTPVEYARIQNSGGVIKNGFGKGIRIIIPARPFDEFSEKDKEEINQLTEVYLNGED